MRKLELTEFKSFGITEKNNTPLVSSRMIAERFNKRHDDVIKGIKKEINYILQSNNRHFSDINFIKTAFKDSRGRKQTEYLLTRDGFMSIVLKYSGKKATAIRIAYINAFNQMESFIKTMLEAKADFPELTSAIAASHEDPKPYHFSNELNMINRIAIGMTSKQFKEYHNLGKVNSIRPYLTPEQIEAVKTLQRIDIGLIVAIPNYQDRKKVLEQQYQRLQQKLLKGA